MDVSIRKRLLRDRERCLRWAETSAEPMRATLLNLARLYESEITLRYRTADCLSDSRELLLRVDATLDRQGRKPALPAGR